MPLSFDTAAAIFPGFLVDNYNVQLSCGDYTICSCLEDLHYFDFFLFQWLLPAGAPILFLVIGIRSNHIHFYYKILATSLCILEDLETDKVYYMFSIFIHAFAESTVGIINNLHVGFFLLWDFAFSAWSYAAVSGWWILLFRVLPIIYKMGNCI